MDAERDQRFREAVERKKDEARNASRRLPEDGTPHGSQVGEGEQPGRVEAARSQQAAGVRDQSSGHGKKTADKWNQ